jgi:hypothetical protein
VLRRLLYSSRFRPALDRARLFANVLRFGREAPRPHERIWIDPSAVECALDGLPVLSGHVVDRWPPAEPAPFEDHVHVRLALAHWRDGVPWEETGAYEYMLRQIAVRGRQDGCHDLGDVKRRYERLDALYETVRREGRLRTRPELDPAVHNEDGGIFVHIGPGGEPAIGDGGKHRLLIARLLGVAVVPARLGYIHRDALPLLPGLRRPPAPALSERPRGLVSTP